MNADCEIRLRYHRGPKRGPDAWRFGKLTTDNALAATCGGVAVLVNEDAYPPSEVAEVRIFSDCPVELLDAAVEAGYWVLGQPRRAEA